MATCPQSDYRNGVEAVEEGLKACEISDWQYWEAVDVLAAAYAESGDFDQAIQFGNLALSLPGLSPKDRMLLQDRLSFYQSSNAIRDGGPSGGSRNLIDEGVRAYAELIMTARSGASTPFYLRIQAHPSRRPCSSFFDGMPDETSRAPWAPSNRLPLTNAFYYRGLTYERKQQWDNAIADFTTVIRREPASTAALRERGITYSRKGEMSGPFEILTRSFA